MPKRKTDDYEVGYRRPPRNHRWMKGQSGNPKRRPGKSRNMPTLLADALSRPVMIRENGQTRTVAFMDAWVQKIMHGVLNGSVRDQIALMAALHKYIPEAINPMPDVHVTIRYVKSPEATEEEPASEESAPDFAQDD